MAFIYVLPAKHIKDISWWENSHEIQIPMCMKKLWLKHSHTHLSTYCLGLLLKYFLSGASWKMFTNLDLEHYPWLAASLPSGNLLEMQSWAHRRLLNENLRMESSILCFLQAFSVTLMQGELWESPVQKNTKMKNIWSCNLKKRGTIAFSDVRAEGMKLNNNKK